MLYEGNLYGRLGGKYIELGPTAKDYDQLVQRVKDLEAAAQAVVDGWEHPDNVGEMWIPDFCQAPIDNLKKLLNQK